MSKCVGNGLSLEKSTENVARSDSNPRKMAEHSSSNDDSKKTMRTHVSLLFGNVEEKVGYHFTRVQA